jgi:hypothetical protein
MGDVTVVLDAYRECVRHVWNAYFGAAARATMDWNAVDDFGIASTHLFRALVLRKLGLETRCSYSVDETRQEPPGSLRIELDPCGEILINRERSSGYWDHPLTNVKKGELELAFLDYFDWSVTDHRDFAYYRVRIVGSVQHPEVVGKDALVPIGPHVRVMCEAAQQADAADEAQGGTRTAS